MIELLYPKDGARLSVLSDKQREFIYHQEQGYHTDISVSYKWLDEKYADSFVGTYVDNPDSENYTIGLYNEFGWKSDVPCRLELTRKSKQIYPNDPAEWDVLPEKIRDGVSIALVGNLFARTEYSWRVVSVDGSQMSQERSFTTMAESPRAICAQGTSNMRDIGALQRWDGTWLRQGCIYRGACLESELEHYHKLTEKGKTVLKDQIKIKTELDLRSQAVGKISSSTIGDDVKYILLPCSPYGDFYKEENRHICKALVEILADEDNYPIHVHCMAGADRTGTLVMLLGMILGVKFENLVLDYNLTALMVHCQRCMHNVIADTDYALFIDGWDGNGDPAPIVMENVKRFLTEKCGVSEKTVERMKRNLIESYA